MAQFDKRHGGAWDRGSADSYYGRIPRPHYYVGGTGMSEKIDKEQMTQDEIAAYWAGYEENEEAGCFKDYG